VTSAAVGKQIRWMLATRFRDCRASDRGVAQDGPWRGVRRRGALVGHREDLPEASLPASRRLFSTCAASSIAHAMHESMLPVQRSRDRVRCTTTSITTPSPCPSACSTWCAAIWRGRHVHARHRFRVPDVVFITPPTGSARRSCRVRFNPTSFSCTSGCARAAQHPAQKWDRRRSDDLREPQPERVRTVDVAHEDRSDFRSMSDIVELAKQALVIEEHYGTPMDIEWARTARRQDYFFSTAETVQSAPAAHPALHAQGAFDVISTAAASVSAWAPCPGHPDVKRCRACAGECCRGHDGPDWERS